MASITKCVYDTLLVYIRHFWLMALRRCVFSLHKVLKDRSAEADDAGIVANMVGNFESTGNKFKNWFLYNALVTSNAVLITTS